MFNLKNNKNVPTGISLEGIDFFVKSLESPLGDKTTDDICNQIVKPITAAEKISYCDYLKQDDETMCYVGKANVFVSHAWRYKFSNVVSALKNYNFPKKTYLWFDLFSNNQHLTDNPFDWWCKTFDQAIGSMYQVVMIMEPWNDPISLQRVWCLFEVYCSINSGRNVEIAMSLAGQEKFEQEILTNSAAFFDMLGKIDVRKSQASKESDRKQILKEVRNNRGGFRELNRKIIEKLKEWIIRKAKLMVERFKTSSPDSRPSLDLERGGGFPNPDSPAWIIKRMKMINLLGDLYGKVGKYSKATELFEKEKDFFCQHLNLKGSSERRSLQRRVLSRRKVLPPPPPPSEDKRVELAGMSKRRAAKKEEEEEAEGGEEGVVEEEEREVVEESGQFCYAQSLILHGEIHLFEISQHKIKYEEWNRGESEVITRYYLAKELLNTGLFLLGRILFPEYYQAEIQAKEEEKRASLLSPVLQEITTMTAASELSRHDQKRWLQVQRIIEDFREEQYSLKLLERRITGIREGPLTLDRPNLTPRAPQSRKGLVYTAENPVYHSNSTTRSSSSSSSSSSSRSRHKNNSFRSSSNANIVKVMAWYLRGIFSKGRLQCINFREKSDFPNRAKALFELYNGLDHPDTLEMEKVVVYKALFSKGDYESTIFELEEIYDHQLKASECFPTGHPYLIDTLRRLGEFYVSLDLYFDARYYYRTATRLMEEKYGRHHPVFVTLQLDYYHLRASFGNLYYFWWWMIGRLTLEYRRQRFPKNFFVLRRLFWGLTTIVDLLLGFFFLRFIPTCIRRLSLSWISNLRWRGRVYRFLRLKPENAGLGEAMLEFALIVVLLLLLFYEANLLNSSSGISGDNNNNNSTNSSTTSI